MTRAALLTLAIAGCSTTEPAGPTPVPASLAGPLAFETRAVTLDNPQVGTWKIRVDVPRDWRQPGRDSFVPPSRGGDSRAELSLSTWCTGPMTGTPSADLAALERPCPVKDDWAAEVAGWVAEQREVALQVLGEDKGTGVHVLTTEIGGAMYPEPATVVQVYRWTPTSGGFLLCTAKLDGALVERAAAFEHACRHALVSR